jgi:pimeloyl-ACP methyl ester carboxylesterase
MLFKEFGSRDQPTVILLHGGGLSWWSLREVAAGLQERYHVVTPVIDGHGEDGRETFVSIEDSARKLIRFIDEESGGHVHALGGLSIGAQIVTEVLSQRSDMARCAVLESALVHPMKGAAVFAAPVYQLSYGLIKRKWFAKEQAKALHVPDALFSRYYEDSLKMSKKSLIHIMRSNGNYRLKETIREVRTKALIIVGERELAVMKKSAETLRESIPGSKLFIAPHMGHGEFSLKHPNRYGRLLENWFEA